MVLQSATLQSVKDKAVWNLPEILKREGVTAYRLHKTIAKGEGGASRNTVYRWARELPDTLDVALLASVIYGLRELTGKRFTVSDLLEIR